MSEMRSWMYDQWHRPPRSGLKIEYINGVDAFLTFACENTETPDMIRCPCKKCNIMRIIHVEDVKLHLLKWGFMPRYYVWTSHGEEEVVEPQNVMEDTSTHNQLDMNVNSFIEMVHAAAGPSFNVPEMETVDEEPNPKAKEFFKLLESAKKQLWQGSNDSVLSLTAKLLNLKSKHNASQSLFNDHLDIILPNLPESHDMPKNFYEAKKLVKALALPHEKIDVCANGCMLFWKEDSNLHECKFCQHPRYKSRARSSSGKGNNMPFRRLHYLPLIPRLQRLYACEENAKNMTWHAERSSEEGKMAHPSDSEAWKDFDRQYKEFSSDPRNVRLGLCIDGFQPFGQSGKNFSCWPILVTIYNLPPWLCMKKPFIFLSLLAPGPENPKHKIDIYMQPLIDELLLLWNEGVETYDAYRKQNFMLKAALMWTISDYPAYAMLSGWSTAGKLACPYCMGKTGGFSHDVKACMEKVLGRPVAIAEVFMFTHTNKKDKVPIDDSAAVIEELFRERMPNIFEYFGKKDPIPDELLREADEVFLECAGGVKNGRIKGLGNLSSEYTSGSVSHTMPNEVLTQQVSQLLEENSRLREDLSAVRESLAEERESNGRTICNADGDSKDCAASPRIPPYSRWCLIVRIMDCSYFAMYCVVTLFCFGNPKWNNISFCNLLISYMEPLLTWFG